MVPFVRVLLALWRRAFLHLVQQQLLCQLRLLRKLDLRLAVEEKRQKGLR